MTDVASADKYQFTYLDLSADVLEHRPAGATLVWHVPGDDAEPFVIPVATRVRGPYGLDITIPAGFRFDGASVPRVLWGFISRTDARIWNAAIVHDFLYQERAIGKNVADSIFDDLMAQSGMPPVRRWLARKAVEYGGRRAWQT